MAVQATSVSIRDGIVHVDGKPILFAVVATPGDPSVKFLYNARSAAEALPVAAHFFEMFRMTAIAEAVEGQRLVQPVAAVLAEPNGGGRR